ncbi:peroxide stress protein YaaA [Alcanivorax sp. 1008]|uniref:peroxide stress protein YaaA n=1 Tax=Alcanivorax sp. 1008 TaxID=2816853 RepID=UPI001D75B57A|nr:peroxide stress protein YaaA [Alcanivorax sp. 1008]MCC1497749.1 peroxide stress protein YaaA [Alcanivorax sp. 1008]
MFIVLSPAKTLDYTSQVPSVKTSLPRLLEHSEILNHQLREHDAKALAKLMKVSEAIARLNVERNQAWEPGTDQSSARPALFAFRGDVYTGLDVDSFTKKDLEQAQKRLRILSGLYGLLRPLDMMRPYRLEMGTLLSNPAGRDLYAFWGDTVSELLKQDMEKAKAETLVNLASQEYFRAVRPAVLGARIITPVFQDEKNGKYKVISFYAKKARGLMAAWILRNNIQRPEQLEQFSEAGYRFVAEDSHADTLLFRRSESEVGKI